MMKARIAVVKNIVLRKRRNRNLHGIRWIIKVSSADLLDLKVKHKVFGIGVITGVSGNYLTIKFAAKESKFVYPDAFEKFIVADDASIQAKIVEEINNAKLLLKNSVKQQRPLVRLKKNVVQQIDKLLPQQETKEILRMALVQITM